MMGRHSNGITPVYPKTGRSGGGLIREVIRFLRTQGISLPLTSHILIATSGGCDSIALAHLLVHYGRRIIGKEKITLLHVNHGWRGAESNADESFVESLGKQWNIPVILRKFDSSQSQNTTGRSWEEKARECRKKIFAEEVIPTGAVVLTAHHADDLVETLLWRLFTGSIQTHGAGIFFRHGVELRPFLTVTKLQLKAYLQEEGQSYREDSTNQSDRFLRSRMRQRLIPEINKLFPRASEHLVKLGLAAQKHFQNLDKSLDFEVNLDDHLSKAGLPYEILLQAAGLRVRRPHLETIAKKWIDPKQESGELHLPGGWRLAYEKRKVLKKNRKVGRPNQDEFVSSSDRWILERI